MSEEELIIRKQSYNSPNFEIEIVKPFFYKQCKKCGDSIKHEEMWSVLDNTNSRHGLEMILDMPNPKKYLTYYFCSRCFSINDIGRESLVEYMENNTINYYKKKIERIEYAERYLERHINDVLNDNKVNYPT